VEEFTGQDRSAGLVAQTIVFRPCVGKATRNDNRPRRAAGPPKDPWSEPLACHAGVRAGIRSEAGTRLPIRIVYRARTPSLIIAFERVDPSPAPGPVYGAKYPLMSKNTSAASETYTLIAPPVPAGTIAALARISPSHAFSVDTTGSSVPDGHVVSQPR
jgi:hypothetical protein